MNFSSHQKELIRSIERVLSKDKREICSGFLSILEKASSLYRTKDYDFWILQIQKTPIEEIPMTIYGHQNATYRVRGLEGESMPRVRAGIVSISTDLFTYSNENSLCVAQSEYHHYYDDMSKTVYKESVLGFLDGIEYGAEIQKRIAKVSELEIDAEELYQ